MLATGASGAPSLLAQSLGGLCACQMAARHVPENNHLKIHWVFFSFFRFRLHSLLPSPEGIKPLLVALIVSN